jgi:hypothetical protein
MTSFQIIMLVLAGGLVVSVFWDRIKAFIPVPKWPINNPPKKDDHSDSELVTIVNCWENLKGMCVDANLMVASEELQKIFPLLIIAEKSDELKSQKWNDLQGTRGSE